MAEHDYYSEAVVEDSTDSSDAMESMSETLSQDENRTDIEREFPDCKQLQHVDFPEAVTYIPEMEESDTQLREEGLEKLEKKMNEPIEDYSSQLESDVIMEGAAEINPCIFGSVAQLNLVNQADDGFNANYAVSSIIIPISTGKVLPDKYLRKISNVIVKMKDLCPKKVKVHRRQCEDLLQRSSEASNEIHALYRGRLQGNWAQHYMPSLMSTLDRLVSCMKAGRELLYLCGDHKEQKVALVTLSSPTPYRKYFSHFALVLRDLEFYLEIFRFLLNNPEAGHATDPREQRDWLSKFSWCERRCRLVFAGDSENRVADAASANSCLAADDDRHTCGRKDLISYKDSLSRHSWAPRSSKSKKFQSFMRNRLEGDSSFSNPNIRVPGCYLLPGKLTYNMIQYIGGGAYKAVHKCEWLKMEVAIATFQTKGDAAVKEKLEAEAGLLARVQHPNVVTFIGYWYDVDEDQGFLVTELMEGDLRTLINKNMQSKGHGSKAPFTLPVSIDMMSQIAEAMVHVHECRVIHRDLKALNCLFNRKCVGVEGFTVKLIDFGESNLRSTESGSNFCTRNRGTTAWMAPEVHRKKGVEMKEYYTWSADVYSFGMTCFEILTGIEHPFGEIGNRQLKEMVYAGCRPEIPAECPSDLVELITKCWAQNPDERPSFKEIRQILWNCKLHYTIWEI